MSVVFEHGSEVVGAAKSQLIFQKLPAASFDESTIEIGSRHRTAGANPRFFATAVTILRRVKAQSRLRPICN